MAPRTLDRQQIIGVLRNLIQHLELSFEGEQDAAEAYGVRADLDKAYKLVEKLSRN